MEWRPAGDSQLKSDTRRILLLSQAMCLERCCTLGPGSSEGTSGEANSVAGRKGSIKGWGEGAETPVRAKAGAAQMTSLPHKLVLLGGPESGLTSLSQPPREVLDLSHAASGSQAISGLTPAPWCARSVLGSYTCSSPGHPGFHLILLFFLASSPSPLCFLSGPSHSKEAPETTRQHGAEGTVSWKTKVPRF